jgi:hypothetical protein
VTKALVASEKIKQTCQVNSLTKPLPGSGTIIALSFSEKQLYICSMRLLLLATALFILLPLSLTAQKNLGVESL